MPVLKLTLKNVAIVRKGLEDLRAEIPRVSRTRMRNLMDVIKTRMQRYPAKRPGQKYVRTYTFQRSWKVTKTAGGYALSSDAEQHGRHYSRYVVGTPLGKKQAWMHAGRWHLFKDVIVSEVKKLPKAILQNIRGLKRVT